MPKEIAVPKQNRGIRGSSGVLGNRGGDRFEVKCVERWHRCPITRLRWLSRASSKG